MTHQRGGHIVANHHYIKILFQLDSQALHCTYCQNWILPDLWISAYNEPLKIDGRSFLVQTRIPNQQFSCHFYLAPSKRLYSFPGWAREKVLVSLVRLQDSFP